MPNPTILVVDDDMAIRESVRAGLRMENYDLVFARDGAEALELIKESTPVVVILDLKMPVMGGLEFLSKVEFKPTDPFSVVILTAFVDDDSAEACYGAGVSAMVKKPFALNELRGAVHNAIANREHSSMFDQMLVGRVATEMMQEKISQRLDVLGKYLQDLAKLPKQVGLHSEDEPDIQPGDDLVIPEEPES